jgi:hypothetical protein
MQELRNSTQKQLNRLELGQKMDLDIKSVIPMDKQNYVQKVVHRPDEISWTSHEDIRPFWTDFVRGIGFLIGTIFVLAFKITLSLLSVFLRLLGQMLLILGQVLLGILSSLFSESSPSYHDCPKPRPRRNRGTTNIFIQNNIFYND